MAPPKKKSSKKQQEEEQSAAENVELPKLERISIEQMILQSLQRFSNQDHITKTKRKELNQLAIFMQEYMSSFILVGFSLDDEKTVMAYMPTAKDESAVIELFRSTMLDILGNRP